MLLPEAPLSIDEIDLLEGDFKAALFHRHEHVVRFVGAAEQAAVGDLLNAVLLLAGDRVDFAAEVEVDIILHHRFPEGGFRSLHREHTGRAERSHRAEDGCVTHHDDVIDLVAMFFENSFKPLELRAGHSGGDFALLAFAGFKNIDGDEEGVFVGPVKGGAFHVVGTVEGHLEMASEGFLVMWDELGLVATPRVVADLVITEGGLNLEVMISPSLDPLRVIKVGPFVDVLLCRSPMPHDKITRDHHESGVLLLH